MTCTMRNFSNLGHEEILSKHIIKITRDIFLIKGDNGGKTVRGEQSKERQET